jgi:hypothetical protein
LILLGFSPVARYFFKGDQTKNTIMKLTVRILTLFFFLTQYSIGQSVSINNPNFSSGTASWGCNPEVNPESTYGGWSNNRVAEVDEEANLCQTINGFTPGAVYSLKFVVSRRTNCGPNVQSMQVSIAGSSTTVTRSGTSFTFTQETIQFQATANVHTLSFSTQLSGTCNLLVDAIEIKRIGGLPVELTEFIAEVNGKKAELNWSTASELRNDFFTVERSADGTNWETIAKVNGAGTTTQANDYTFTDYEPLNGVSYYRLSQTDLDGTHVELKTESILMNNGVLTAYPNPASDVLTVSGLEEDEEITILDAAGRAVSFAVSSAKSGVTVIDLTQIPAGSYLLKTTTGYLRFMKQ